MIVFASTILILTVGLLILNPSMLTNAQGQMYDKHPKKSSDINIQKIKCVNSNVNVNGIDITQVPQDGTATAAANELQQANEQNPNGANGNGLSDRINFDRNLVNICVNVNANEQVKVSPPPDEEPTATLSVSKTVTCDPGTAEAGVQACQRIQAVILPNDFSFALTGNNPNPDSFVGSTVPVIVTLDPGNYELTETVGQSVQITLAIIQVELGVSISGHVIFSGDCTVDLVDPLVATGTIASVESKACNIENALEIFE